MFQIVLKYTEFHTNMAFENIPTLPLKIHSGIDKTNTNKYSIISGVKIYRNMNPNNVAYDYNV